MTINRDEARQMASEVLDELFDRLGVDLQNKEDVRQFRQDLQFVRRQRRGAEEMGGYIRKATIFIIIGAGFSALWWGLKVAFSQ